MNRAKQIKEILIKMAIDATLPSDMNELDEHVFDTVFEGTVDPCELKDRYVSLEVPDPSRFVGPGRNKIMVNIRVKLDDEGVVVDAFQPRQDKDTGEYYQEPIATTWKTYQMMKDGEE
jgi:hypothetical protein